jgi:hypothetical protein
MLFDADCPTRCQTGKHYRSDVMQAKTKSLIARKGKDQNFLFLKNRRQTCKFVP